MANELQINASLTFSPATTASFSSQANKQPTVAGTKAIKDVKAVTTSDTVLPLGDVGTVGYLMIRNLDATNFVTLGTDGTNYGLKLKAGEFMLVRWNAAAIHAKADTATCEVELTIIND